MKKFTIICGPTASGKTQFAHLFAKNKAGEIINADSMQLYKQIPIITASPTEKLKNELPYHLYNFLDIENECSLAKYANIAAETIKQIATRGKLPILVGGSGMYISAITKGFSQIPKIDAETRINARSIQESMSSEKFFDLLQKLDPKIASVLHPQDSQRVVRAYEVFVQTGRSILDYHKTNVRLIENFDFEIINLSPERKFLYSMCNHRLDEMFKNGAVILEIEELIKHHKNLKTSAMKALGIREIILYLEGKLSKKDALEQAKTKTRQYAKRQITWFKNQIKEKRTLEFSNEAEYQNIISQNIMIR